MAKANKKAKAKDKKTGNDNFNSFASVFDDMIEKSQEVMPLLAASMELSKKILKEYQKAYNNSLE